MPGGRAAGSQSWVGLLNTHCWFDPVHDVAAVLMTQTLPFLDSPFMQVYAEFEQAAYGSVQSLTCSAHCSWQSHGEHGSPTH